MLQPIIVLKTFHYTFEHCSNIQPLFLKVKIICSDLFILQIGS